MPGAGFGPSSIDSYAVFRELHNPEFIFADAFLMFEKIMELGVKDLYYVGEPPKIVDDYDNFMCMSDLERSRMQKKRMLELKEEDASRTALRKRCFKITNHMMKLVDPELHNHLQEVEFIPELSLLKWLRVMYSREFDVASTLTIWDYIFSDIDYSLVTQRKFDKLVRGQKSFYQQEDYMTGTQDFIANMDYLALAMF